jgi:hypothetical protein
MQQLAVSETLKGIRRSLGTAQKVKAAVTGHGREFTTVFADGCGKRRPTCGTERCRRTLEM